MKEFSFRVQVACSQLLLTFGAALTLFGCDRKSGVAEASEALGRPGDCELFKQRVCGLAGDKSPTCGAAQLILDVTTDASCALNLKEFSTLQARYTELRKPCAAVVSEVCEKAGEQSETCAAVREQVVEVPVADCQKMHGKVDQIVAELKVQELIKRPLDEVQQAKIAEGDGPAFGPPDAKVTVVEFSDFQCPYCARAANVAKHLRSNYADRVRFVFRQFPLPNHEHAQLAAQASLAAHAQGKFWQYHDRLFANQNRLDVEALKVHARAERLDMAKFVLALDDEQLGNNVLADVVLAGSLAIQATPTLFINGKRAINPTDVDSVVAEIELALKR